MTASPGTVSLPQKVGPESYPLSFAQERLWFLHMAASDRAAFNMVISVQLTGPLHLPALDQAFQALIDRHKVLRSRFVCVDGICRQVIAPVQPVLEPPIRLTAPSRDQAAEIRQRINEASARAFDLANEIPLRASVLILGPAKHVLIVVVHHVVCDAWSMALLARDLGLSYQAALDRTLDRVARPALQYGEWAAAQRRRDRGAAQDRQLRYWLDRLAGADRILQLRTDRPRPAVPSHRGAMVPVHVPQPLAKALNRLARAEGATLFMVLLAAFHLLLSRWSGENQTVVGTPVAGRTERATETVIGLFLNSLALQTDISANPTVRTLLGSVRESTIDAFDHQDIPFERIVEELNPRRDPSRWPIFQAMLVMQNAAPPRLALQGLEVVQLGRSSNTTKYDITLYLTPGPDGITGYLEYAADLFYQETIEVLVQDYVANLQQMAADPDQPVFDVGYGPDTVVAPARPAPSAATTTAGFRCVHQQVTDRAALMPDSVVVLDGDLNLSLHAVERRSNQIAHHLRRRGVGLEAVVGLCMARSAEAIVALLGVLKSGAAFLPLDPTLSPPRIRAFAGDAKPSLIVAESATAELVATLGIPLLLLDRDGALLGMEPASAPSWPVFADNIAYLLYTSGSSGRPKGVAGRHGAIAARLAWDPLPPEPGETYAFKTSPGFIDSLWEVFKPLLWGGRTIVVRNDIAMDPDRLIALMAEALVSRVVLVPTLLRAILLRIDTAGERLYQLRYWACSGEKLPPDLIELFEDRRPGATLLNIYGTTEFWDASCEVVDSSAWPANAIGSPVPGMALDILDDALRPVPRGAPGELYVAGAGLARGYHAAPASTAERFVPSTVEAGGRWYRTGDMVRALPDGRLEYLRRRDAQLSLHGHRIEPAEIEMALRSWPGVDAAALVRPGEASGPARLVAYVTGRSVSTEGLGAHLRSMLPHSMVPARILALDTLPLTSSGKLDRRALSALPVDRLEEARIAPRTDFERTLSDMWAMLLDIDEVGIDENFFDLGGHSLMLPRMQALILQATGRDTPITAFFQHGSIRTLAQYLTRPAAAARTAPGGDRGSTRRQALVGLADKARATWLSRSSRGT